MANKQSPAGHVTAIKLRHEALNAYNADPNLCKHCGSIIYVPDGVKVSHVRRKIFCNRSCAVAHNNHVHPKRKRTWSDRPLRKHCCRKCGEIISSHDGRRKYCTACKAIMRRSSVECLDDRTKGDLFARNANWQSARSSLRRHAYKTYFRGNGQKRCALCHYSLHVDIAHVRPVRQFPDDALISEINNIANLMALCPNHHWEFDNGLLDLPEINK